MGLLPHTILLGTVLRIVRSNTCLEKFWRPSRVRVLLPRLLIFQLVPNGEWPGRYKQKVPGSWCKICHMNVDLFDRCNLIRVWKGAAVLLRYTRTRTSPLVDFLGWVNTCWVVVDQIMFSIVFFLGKSSRRRQRLTFDHDVGPPSACND